MKSTLKKFIVVMDDGKDIFNVAVPAEDENVARNYVAGNGEVIAVVDVTESFPISVDKVIDALKNAYFSDVEINLIQRTLTLTNIAE